MRLFVLGFLLGALSMYWFDTSGDQAIVSAVEWLEGSASNYRGTDGADLPR